MGIFLDVSIIILFIVFIVSGFKKGLIKSLVGFVGTIIAIFLSAYLSRIVSLFIYDNFVRDTLLVNINDILNEYVEHDLNEKALAVFNGLPNILSNALTFCGITSNVVGNVIESSAGNASYALVELFYPTIISIIKTILMPFIFLIVIIPINLLTKVVGKVSRFPVLRQIDQIIGATIAALKCFVLILLITFLLRMFLPMMGSIPNIFSKNTIESTFLFKNFYDNNMIYNFFVNRMKSDVHFSL